MAFFSLTLILLVLLPTLYLVLKRKQQYWIRRNVPSEPSSFFYFGWSKHPAFYIQEIYQRFKNCGQPFMGMFLSGTPAVLPLDLELIKNVLISDFDSFPDRGFYNNVVDDPLSGHIFRLEDQAWKRLRTKLTPTFSSSKMRFMFPTVVGVGERFVELIQESLQSMEASSKELEMRDLCSRFTTDVIGTVAFGLECNSLREPHTEFRVTGDMAFSCFNPFLEAVAYQFPRLSRFLHVKAYPQYLINFYTKIVTQTIEYREKHNVRRNDFLDILIELKNTKVDGETVLTMNEIIGQAFVFFASGFGTSSGAMTFALYELSRNQAMQDKTRENIMEALKKHNNELTYESLMDMNYLEHVFAETLRMYPIGHILRRVARKNYKVPNTSHIIEKGVQVLIPVYALHHDPEYYPQPEKFMPERFAADERQKRHPMTYLPFGAGPRDCMALRFGRMQTMIGLAMLLKHFKFTISIRTPVELEYDVKNVLILSVLGGVHLKVQRL